MTEPPKAPVSTSLIFRQKTCGCFLVLRSRSGGGEVCVLCGAWFLWFSFSLGPCALSPEWLGLSLLFLLFCTWADGRVRFLLLMCLCMLVLMDDPEPRQSPCLPAFAAARFLLSLSGRVCCPCPQVRALQRGAKGFGSGPSTPVHWPPLLVSRPAPDLGSVCCPAVFGGPSYTNHSGLHSAFRSRKDS